MCPIWDILLTRVPHVPLGRKMTVDIHENPTKFSKSRSIGELRANIRIKKFLVTLQDKETRHLAGSELWNDALFDKSRDTKQYFRYLVLRLSYIAYEFAIANDERYIQEVISRHLKRLKEDLVE